MKQIQKTKRHRGSPGGRQEPLAADPRDPDIVHAHRIARRSSRPGAVERHEPHGVWGGEIFARGAIIAEKRPRGRPPSKLRPVIGVDARAIA